MSDLRDDSHDEGADGGGRRGALVAILVLAVLAVGGWWMSRSLHQAGRVQDCVMAGRTNCAPMGQ
jgi:hypothetical protein